MTIQDTKIYFVKDRCYFDKKETKIKENGVKFYPKLVGIILEWLGYVEKFHYIREERKKKVYLNIGSLKMWSNSRSYNDKNSEDNCYNIHKANKDKKFWFMKDFDLENPPLNYNQVIERAREEFREDPEQEEIIKLLAKELKAHEYKEFFKNKKLFFYDAVRVIRGDLQYDYVKKSYIKPKPSNLKEKVEDFIETLPGIEFHFYAECEYIVDSI